LQIKWIYLKLFSLKGSIQFLYIQIFISIIQQINFFFFFFFFIQKELWVDWDLVEWCLNLIITNNLKKFYSRNLKILKVSFYFILFYFISIWFQSKIKIKCFFFVIDFNEQAIELAARKVSAVTGDIRKSFTICRKAVDIAKEAKKTVNFFI